MPEREKLSDYELAKLLMDPRRREILDIASAEPVTVTQIAERLNEAPSRLYYHVKKLEDAQFLELVETRPNGNLLEKYYRTVPQRRRTFELDPAVLMENAEDFNAQLMNVLQPGLNKLSESIRAGLTPEEAQVHLEIGYRKFTDLEWEEFCLTDKGLSVRQAAEDESARQPDDASSGSKEKGKYAYFLMAYRIDEPS